MGDKSEAHERSLAKREDRSSRRKEINQDTAGLEMGPPGIGPTDAAMRRTERRRPLADPDEAAKAAFLSNYLLPFLGPEAPGSLTARPAAPPWSCCFLLRMTEPDLRSLVLDLLDLTEERAAGFPPGFFPSLTSTPLRGAPAMAVTGASTRVAATASTRNRGSGSNAFMAILPDLLWQRRPGRCPRQIGPLGMELGHDFSVFSKATG